MTNKLGAIRAENVRKIMQEKQLERAELFKTTGVSLSTIGNCFGEVMKSAPSNKTIGRILKAFRLPDGALDKPEFDPATAATEPLMFAVEAALPAIIPQTKITIQIGKTTIDTEVDEEIATRILKLVVLGDSV